MITSEYGAKGCEVVLPEGRWMLCAVVNALKCDGVCQLMNQSLSAAECAGPYFVIPPTTAPLVYPTWEGNDALPITASPGEGAGKWLGNPAKLLLKQDNPQAIICFKIKEIVKGHKLLLIDWPRPKCGNSTTFVCGKKAPQGIFSGVHSLRADAVPTSQRVTAGCEVSLPDGEWVVGVVGDEIVTKCLLAEDETTWSTASCIRSTVGVGQEACSVCPQYRPSQGMHFVTHVMSHHSYYCEYLNQLFQRALIFLLTCPSTGTRTPPPPPSPLSYSAKKKK